LRKKDWELTPEAFNGLLARFDPDAERAGRRYELIRSEVIKFFECRGCFTPRDLADETINRVARKITEGENIEPGAIQSYFYGVARNVFREYVRSPERETPHVEAMHPSEHPSVNPVDLNLRRADRARLEQRLECLESCVAQLSPETRSLIISYYEGEEGVKIANRKRMAEALGIPLNTLRIRIHRIREKLERCVVMCLNATGE
jgi:RNA polymerase sigma factor (sigma-70 family)